MCVRVCVCVRACVGALVRASIVHQPHVLPFAWMALRSHQQGSDDKVKVEGAAAVAAEGTERVVDAGPAPSKRDVVSRAYYSRLATSGGGGAVVNNRTDATPSNTATEVGASPLPSMNVIFFLPRTVFSFA